MKEELLKQAYQEYLNTIFEEDTGYQKLDQFQSYWIVVQDGSIFYPYFYNVVDQCQNLKLSKWYSGIQRCGESYLLHDMSFDSITLFGEHSLYKKYDRISPFLDGHTIVKKKEKYNYINLTGQEISNEWYDQAYRFENGYAMVIKGEKRNFINGRGNLISKKWFDYAFDFENGYARVKRNGKYNFIGTDGNLISEVWYDDVFDFENGYAGVKQDGRNNFIGTDGKLISEEWFDWAADFCNGYARVKRNGKHNFIGTDGNLISEVWFADASDFCNGYAVIEGEDGKSNFINQNGKIISEEWFDAVSDFSDGYAIIEGKKKNLNFIDQNGKVISEEWFDDAFDFSDGYAIVEKNKKTMVIDSTGDILFVLPKKSYKIVESFENGYATVKDKRTNQYNFIDHTGNLKSDCWYDSIEDYSEFYQRVSRNGNFNLIDQNKNLVLDTWYSTFSHGKATKAGIEYLLSPGTGKIMGVAKNYHVYDLIEYQVVEQHGLYNLIDTSGNLLFDVWKETKEALDPFTEPLKTRERLVYQKTLFSYQYQVDETTITLRYKPVKDYGTLLLCEEERKGNYYFYDKESQQYYFISCCGNKNVKIGDHYVIINQRFFFIQNNLFTEITDFPFRKNYKLKKGIDQVLSYEEFNYEYQRDPQLNAVLTEKIKQAKLEQEKEAEIQKEVQLKKMMEENKWKRESQITEKLNQMRELQKQFVTFYEQYKLLEQEINGLSPTGFSAPERIRVDPELLFERMNDATDAKEISPIFIRFGLRYLDLSLISFDQVKLAGVDLSYTNANIDPQTIYQKDMRGGNYAGLSFVAKDFRGVKTTGANFENCNFDFTTYVPHFGKQKQL